MKIEIIEAEAYMLILQDLVEILDHKNHKCHGV